MYKVVRVKDKLYIGLNFFYGFQPVVETSNKGTVSELAMKQLCYEFNHKN